MPLQSFRLCYFLVSLCFIAITCFSNSAVAADISGTVNYPGGIAKRVFITANYVGGTSVASIAASGSTAFYIRGVPPGTYTLNAFADTTDTRSQHAFDPYGSSTAITVSSANVSGVNITLADPPAVFPTAPATPKIIVGNNSAILKITAVYAGSPTYKELADSYIIYWSTSPAVSPTNTVGGGSKTVPSGGGSMSVLVTGLQNGQNYYFIVTSKYGAQESLPSAVTGPITIGAPSTGSTVSGTITSSSNGNQVIVVVENGIQAYFCVYQNPIFPMAYTVGGVSDGYYQISAALDVNGDGILQSGSGDVWTRGAGTKRVIISNGPVTGLDIGLPSQDAEAVITTQHWQNNTAYNAYLNTYSVKKRPVNIAITSGPGITGPVDIPSTNSASYILYSGTTKPTVGSTYGLFVVYSDNTSGNLTTSITGVLEGFAVPSFPVGILNTAVPDFSWGAVSPAPIALYEYAINVTGAAYWNPGKVPASTLSIPFNFDSTAYSYSNSIRTLITELPPGSYNWNVATYDIYGNSSHSNALGFTVPIPAPVNGLCGSSNGALLTIAPTTNLCTTGTASTVTGSGPWNWSCAGTNGGQNVNCTALLRNQSTSLLLPQTGQTSCYDNAGTVIACTDTGQDGEIKAGVAWPTPRFTKSDGVSMILSDDTSTTIVFDRLTGLEWSRNADTPTVTGSVSTCTGGPMTWLSAVNYVKCLNANNYQGHNDWRLPNINELRSLINQHHEDFIWLNSQGFSNAQTGAYWSSTNFAGWSEAAWAAGMNSAYIDYGIKNSNYYNYNVLPVRSGLPGSASYAIPKTGQTACYDLANTVINCASTGQDGELQMGAAWPLVRFTSNPDQTVTDNLTGLAWSKEANPATTAKNWQDALDYIKALNSQSYLGYSDWRLPNINELESLINFEQSNNAAWLNGLGFTHVQDTNYWSSSSPVGTDTAMNVSFRQGYAYHYPRSSGFYVWPVRSGYTSLLINGRCGSSVGGVFLDPPSASLCSAGVASIVTTIGTSEWTTGTWEWTCFGANGGTTASCSADRAYTVSVSLLGDGGGNVTSIPSAISCSTGTCTSFYRKGTEFALTATANGISLFGSWSGCTTSSGTTCNIILYADKVITARFDLAPKAKIGVTGYTSFTDAYNAASTSSKTTIMLLEDVLPISVISIDKPVVLQGGYMPSFSRTISGYTALQGVLSIGGNGIVEVDRVVVK